MTANPSEYRGLRTQVCNNRVPKACDNLCQGRRRPGCDALRGDYAGYISAPIPDGRYPFISPYDKRAVCGFDFIKSRRGYPPITMGPYVGYYKRSTSRFLVFLAVLLETSFFVDMHTSMFSLFRRSVSRPQCFFRWVVSVSIF